MKGLLDLPVYFSTEHFICQGEDFSFNDVSDTDSNIPASGSCKKPDAVSCISSVSLFQNRQPASGLPIQVSEKKIPAFRFFKTGYPFMCFPPVFPVRR